LRVDAKLLIIFTFGTSFGRAEDDPLFLSIYLERNAKSVVDCVFFLTTFSYLLQTLL